jgi:hypothetical protein
MHRRLLTPFALVLSVPSLLGCETTPKQRLQGKWIGEKVDNFSNVQAGRAGGWVSGTIFEFRGSRVVISIPAETPREGTFEIVSVRPEELTLSFLRAGGGKDQVAFRFEADDRLRWQLGDGRSVVLREVN